GPPGPVGGSGELDAEPEPSRVRHGGDATAPSIAPVRVRAGPTMPEAAASTGAAGPSTVRFALRLSLITALAGVGLAASGLALVPAARQLGQAGSSEEAPIDLGPLDQRSYVYAADGALLATLRAEIDRQPVPLSEIPSHVADAVLAVEDADFYAHKGVNLRSMLRALTANVEAGATVQGGSTITQ